MISRRRFLGGAAGAWLVLGPAGLAAQEGVFLKPEEAPRHLFPEATSVTERTEVATPVMQHRIRDLLGRPPSLWEPAYQIFTVKCREAVAGRGVGGEGNGKA